MAFHKFTVGEALIYSPRSTDNKDRNQACTVLRLMPREGVEPQYRIKCDFDNVERIARESQLWPTDKTVDEEAAARWHA